MVVENALEGELNDHLGYSRNDPADRNGGNSRNGYRARTVQTEAGRLTKCHPSSTAALPAATRCGPPDHRSGTAAGPCPGGCDAAVGDVDRAVASGGEAGRELRLADTQVRTVAVPADPDHVACRVRGRALVQPAGLEFGGVERPVLAEARRTAHRPGRATHVGTASLRAPAGTRKKARTFTAPLRLTSARIIGAGVNDVAVPARVEHGVGAGVGEIVRREVDPGRRGWWRPRCSCR